MCCNKNICGSWSCGCVPSRIGYWLVIVGAINWGLVGVGGFFGGNWNLVNMLFGFSMVLEHIVYLLVGVSAVMLLIGCKCQKCKAGACTACVPKGETVKNNPASSSPSENKA